MKRFIATLIDYAAANVVFTGLVALWLIVVVGTAENALTGSDTWSTFGWVVFAPAVFFALVTLKSSDVRHGLWSFIKRRSQRAPANYGPLGISKRKPQR